MFALVQKRVYGGERETGDFIIVSIVSDKTTYTIIIIGTISFLTLETNQFWTK